MKEQLGEAEDEADHEYQGRGWKNVGRQGGVVSGTRSGDCEEHHRESIGMSIHYLGGLVTPSVIHLIAILIRIFNL